MAEEIAAEVWRYAPRDVKNTKRLVLARLAAWANDRRITCVGIDTLMRETAASQAAVYEALSWLYGKGYLQELDASVLPNWSAPYKSVVRRITEREYWDSECPAPVYTLPDSGIQTLQFQILESDMAGQSRAERTVRRLTFPESGPYKSPSSTKKEKITTKAMTTSSGAAEPLQAKTRSFGQRNLGREEDDLDPAKALFAEDHQQTARRGSREPGPDTGMGLALHFSRELTKTGTWKFPDLANRKSLAKTFNSWMKSGFTADEIRMMINIYCSRSDFRNPKKTPWVDFLAQRALLGAEINAESLRASHRPEQ